MKALSTTLLAFAVLAAPAYGQSTATGSAAGSASVSNGQAGANVNTGQQATAGGASASTSAAGSAQAKDRHEAKPKEHESHAKNHGANSSDPGSLSAALASGTTLQAALTKPVDAKKAKPGDQVTAKLTQDVKSNGHVVLHKGSKLVGHVTEAQGRSKGQAESKLGIVFDKAQLKGGEESSLNATIQALAPPVRGTAIADADEAGNLSAPMAGGATGGGGLVGGVTHGASSTLGGATNSVGNVGGGAVAGVNSTVNSAAGTAAGGLNAQGALSSASHGVVGIQGLTLSSASVAGAQGSVISSTTQNVKLDSGTQMVLQVSGASK